MNPAMRHRVEQRRAQGRQCDVQGCWQPVQKLGGLCEPHDKRAEATGHPLGRTIRIGELRPYLQHTRSFIAQHREHPGIRSGIEWIERLIREGTERAPEVIHSRSLPRDRLNAWLRRLYYHAVDPVDVLATVAAMYLHQECDPRRYLEGKPGADRFFRHQLVNRVLRQTRARSTLRSRYCYDRITVGVRDLLSEKLTRALGVLCLRIARTILASFEHQERPERPVQGSDAPFP